jgi:hypothetical protein
MLRSTRKRHDAYRPPAWGTHLPGAVREPVHDQGCDLWGIAVVHRGVRITANAKPRQIEYVEPGCGAGYTGDWCEMSCFRPSRTALVTH